MSANQQKEVVHIRDLEINAELVGDYEFHHIRVQFRIQTGDEGIRALMNENQYTTVSYGLDPLPAGIREAIATYVNQARVRLVQPSREVLGRQVQAEFDIRHAGYRIDVPRHEGEIKIVGYIKWATGRNENFDQTFPSTVFTEEEQRLFRQLHPWARDHAQHHVETELQKLFQSPRPPKVFVRRTKVFLSYRNIEAHEFADQLFHRLGGSGLITPIMDDYDLGAGQWMAQLEDLIDDAAGMVAVVTPTYESGNISELEKDLGLMKSREDRGFVFIPLLLSHKPAGFLSTRQWVDFRQYHKDGSGELFDSAFALLVDLLLGVPLNPYL